jgi:Xaa-Pro dipeptidase
LCKIRFPENILRSRVKRFQEAMLAEGLDAAMLRTESSFIYFVGIKWLRPALLIPAEGEPIVFLVRGEEGGLWNVHGSRI